jgi:tetratricopeptide (TPR) repeat protein
MWLHAQQLIPTDRPTEHIPLRPETRADLDRREARTLYALGLLRQRQDRLLDALHYLEDAAQLDVESAAIPKALIPLYLALGRPDDALAACRTTLDRDPADCEIWYLYGRQLRDLGRPQEALTALDRSVACPTASERLDLLVQMHFERGVLHEEARDWTKAENAFSEAAKLLVDKREALIESGPYSPEQLDGEAAKTYERLGKVCIQAAKYDRAVTAFSRAQKCDPERADRLNFNLAETCLAQRKPADALAYLERYLRTQPQGAQAYELMSSILKELGRARDILPALRQYAERDGRNVPLQLLLARQYGTERQWPEAERRYLKLAEENPTADVYRGLFTLYRNQATDQKNPRVLGRALDVFDQAIAAAEPKDETASGNAAAAGRARAMLVVLRDDPELIKAMLTEAVGDLRAKKERAYATCRLLAALAGRAGQLDHAEQLYKECLGRITPQTEAEVFDGLLTVLAEAKKADEVVIFCKTWRDKAQATNRILFSAKMAPALIQLGKLDEAVAEADEAVKLADDRNRLRIRRLRVAILAQAQRFDRAVAECQAMLKEYNQPGEIRDIRYALSNVYSIARDFPKSEEQLRLILEGDPNDATANNDLGYIMADQGKNLDESEQLIRKAIDLDRAEKKSGTDLHPEGNSDNAAYLDSLGWVLFRRGKPDEARSWLEKAVALPGGDDAVVWDHLGDIYFRLNEPAKARTAWEKAGSHYAKEKGRNYDDRFKELKHKLELLK